eukprot:100648-Pelagomonas_calceolata.AAC.1
MAVGTHVLSGASVLSHIGQLENTLALRNLANISLRHLYTPGIGKFNIAIVNHYLHYLPWNANHKFYLQYSHTDLQQGQINRRFVEHLSNNSAYATAIILTSRNRVGQLHAKTLKKIENASLYAQSTWCILDSENSHPVYLTTDESWHQLSGNILTIQSGSFWDHLADTSDLHLADPHIPLLYPEPTASQNSGTIYMADMVPPPQQHASDQQINPSTSPQGIENAQLHATATCRCLKHLHGPPTDVA